MASNKNPPSETVPISRRLIDDFIAITRSWASHDVEKPAQPSQAFKDHILASPIKPLWEAVDSLARAKFLADLGSCKMWEGSEVASPMREFSGRLEGQLTGVAQQMDHATKGISVLNDTSKEGNATLDLLSKQSNVIGKGIKSIIEDNQTRTREINSGFGEVQNTLRSLKCSLSTDAKAAQVDLIAHIEALRDTVSSDIQSVHRDLISAHETERQQWVASTTRLEEDIQEKASQITILRGQLTSLEEDVDILTDSTRRGLAGDFGGFESLSQVAQELPLSRASTLKAEACSFARHTHGLLEAIKAVTSKHIDLLPVVELMGYEKHPSDVFRRAVEALVKLSADFRIASKEIRFAYRRAEHLRFLVQQLRLGRFQPFNWNHALAEEGLAHLAEVEPDGEILQLARQLRHVQQHCSCLSGWPHARQGEGSVKGWNRLE